MCALKRISARTWRIGGRPLLPCSTSENSPAQATSHLGGRADTPRASDRQRRDVCEYASSRQARTVRSLTVAGACGRPSDVDGIFGGGATNAGLSADSRRWARWLCPLGALGTRFGHVTHLWKARIRGSYSVPSASASSCLALAMRLAENGKKPPAQPRPAIPV